METVKYYMNEAIKEANLAMQAGEIPVGAILVCNGEIIARAHNQREQDHDPLGHAEIIVLRKGANVQNNWRLENCTLYVTLEPCAMCAGAIVSARIKRLIFGAYDAEAGGCGSRWAIIQENPWHTVEMIGGVMEEKCRIQIKNYFSRMRKETKKGLHNPK